MKFIYQMVEDGSYASFKLMTRAATAGNQERFVWAGLTLEVNYAQYVCKYVDNFLQDNYDRYVTAQSKKYDEYY